jgi:hypothetical protein
MLLLLFFHGDGCSALQFRLTWFACWNSSQYQSIPLWSSLVLDYAPEFRVAQSSSLAWIRVDTGQNPEAIVSLVILAQGEFSKRHTHDLFASVASGYLDDLRNAASRYNANNFLTLW